MTTGGFTTINRSAMPTDPTATAIQTLVAYPTILTHEQSLAASPTSCYDVTSWMDYLTSIDDALDSLTDVYTRLFTSINSSTSDGGSSTSVGITKLETGGRTLLISSHKAHGITHTPSSLYKEITLLIQARIVVGERSVALLPGSYKLWKCHLDFLCDLQEKSHLDASLLKSMNQKLSRNRIPLPLLSSSSTSTHNYYEFTKKAFERSLSRLHKSPRLWLNYASFTILYSPERDVTEIRSIYNRMLVALPVTQHDRIWEEVGTWVTGILPSLDNKLPLGSGDGDAWKIIKRRGNHKVKYGFESPLVHEWRRRGWGYDQIMSVHQDDDDDEDDTTSYLPTCPTETALRILRRQLLHDPTFAEDLSTLCITRYHRYGEAASLLLGLLNNADSGNYISPNGTTRHELWLRFADCCTEHPKEAKRAGVDFDGVIRAVLGAGGNGTKMGKGGNELGFQVFDRSGEAFGSETQQQQQEEKEGENKQEGKRELINHRLGEMEGTMWTRLAEYHVRAGDFELARSVYEEALDAITRVRDFSLVFDAYVRFEEGVIEALMELMEEEEEGEDGSGAGRSKEKGKSEDEDLDILLGDDSLQNSLNEDTAGSSADVELAISRAEHLTSRRPLLLNRVLLRQNPHNVGEWIKRSELYLKLVEVELAAAALEEALKSVSARKSVNGSPSAIVLTLVDIHENKRKNVEAARSVFDRICSKNEYDFQDAEDLAQCHAAYVELELRQENWDMALNLARRAVSGNAGGKKSKAVKGLSRSLRLWNLLFDLEESLGTIQTAKDAYDRALEWKVATPSHVLNYAAFLKDKRYFEESFAAYERGLGLFLFPHPGATLLWKSYLTEFLERYEGSKTPRVRELFDRCLADCPSEESPEFYLMYGEYEETHGLTKRALGVYERMCNAVPDSEKFTAYRLYIAKAIQYLGITSARPIYERAISALEDGSASQICLEYAKMETGLREIDRARTVLVYGAQMADPRRDPDYWAAWHEFEVSHGNEETFREMLRVKRSVQAAFSTVNYNAAEMGGAPRVETLDEESALRMIAESEGVEVEKKQVIGGFVASTKKRTAEDLGEIEKRAAKLRQITAAQTDEIDIDDIEEEEPQQTTQPKRSTPTNVQEKVVPAAVFGGLTTGKD
jgi:pre-mRNA-splicing factor SYF1